MSDTHKATRQAGRHGRDTARTPSRAEQYATQYLELAKTVNEAGLLRRRRGFYWALIIGGVIAVAVILIGVALLGDTWWQLLLAALLGVVVAQFGFLGHEAAHKQVFDSPRWNRWVGRFLSGLGTGLSYAWWMDKHGRHHSRPNQLGTDPDIESDVVAFTPEAADRRTGLASALARRQGWFFLPLLLFEGWELHLASVKTLTTRDGMKQRWPELALLTARHVAYLTFLFLTLPPGLAVAFVVVQVSVFGFLLGGAFAPNHIGMPIVGRGVKFDFLRRQVLMSRNIRGGPVVHFFLGGLEYQIEHHLFPKAPRPSLPKLRTIVRDYCRRYGVTYTETSLVQAYRDLMGYLNQVGLKNRNRYTCPLVREYRA